MDEPQAEAVPEAEVLATVALGGATMTSDGASPARPSAGRAVAKVGSPTIVGSATMASRLIILVALVAQPVLFR